MEALAEKPEMLQQAEPALVPLFRKVFAAEDVEYLAEVRAKQLCVCMCVYACVVAVCEYRRTP